MAVNNAPYPSFMKLFYHSEFAPHVMTMPHRTWSPPGGGSDFGFFTPWVGANIDAEVEIDGLVNLLKAVYDADVSFDRWEIWTKASPTDIPVLVANKPISVTGTAVATGWNEAVQVTVSIRCSADNSLFRIVLLDVFTDNFFGKEYDISGSAALQAVFNYVTNDTNAFQSRAGSQPNILRSATTTLNERLRREYHLR
jgi:hypothetical protein